MALEVISNLVNCLKDSNNIIYQQWVSSGNSDLKEQYNKNLVVIEDALLKTNAEWKTGDLCYYPDCFGETKMKYLSRKLVVKRSRLNDCVIEDDNGDIYQVPESRLVRRKS